MAMQYNKAALQDVGTNTYENLNLVFHTSAYCYANAHPECFIVDQSITKKHTTI